MRELCARRIPTRVLCRQQTSPAAFEGLDVEIVTGDLQDTSTLRDAIAGCTCVIHSAAMIHIGWQKLSESRQVNVAGTQAVVDACLETAAKLIHISTVDTLPAAVNMQHPIDESGQGGVPKTPCTYVQSKQESERVVRAAMQTAGLEAIVIHPGFMLGPYDWKPSSGRMFLEVVKSPIVAAPAGGCSLCDARDVAAAIVNSIEAGQSGENYILAGENISYRQLWTQMLAVAGRRRRVHRLGQGIRLVGKLIDAANRYLPIREGDVNGAAIAMGQLNHYYDSRKAERHLSYVRRDPAETLQDAWRWLKR